jgi:hypothetical protein
MGTGEGVRGRISKLCRASAGYSNISLHRIMQLLIFSAGFRRLTYSAIDT